MSLRSLVRRYLRVTQSKHAGRAYRASRLTDTLVLRAEPLEERLAPVYTATANLTAGTVSFFGGAAGDVLTLSVAGGVLTHNRFTAGDPGFSNNADLDTTITGLQSLAIGSVTSITVSAGDGNDTVTIAFTAAVPVTLDGGGGNDSLRGGDGNDVLIGGLGTDTINGGKGIDTLQETRNGDFVLTSTATAGTLVITVGGAPPAGTAETDTIASIERAKLTGGASNNTINTNAFTKGGVTLDGGAGNDTLTAGGGTDVLTGGTGADSISGGLGRDRVIETRDSNMTLTNGTLVIGGEGTDTLVSIGEAYLTGGAGNNNINASAFTSGRVTLDGAAGNDTIIASSGNDLLIGGTGADSIAGGAGNDLLVETRDANMTLTSTSLTIGSEGTDTLSAIEQVSLTGGAGNNNINAAAFTLGQVTLLGLAGNDTLQGGVNPDSLVGGLGNDVIAGGGGNDTITWASGEGSDTLDGEAGTDVLTFSGTTGNDTITGSAAGSTVTVTDGASSLSFSGIEDLRIIARDGADTITINDLTTSALTDLTINTAEQGTGFGTGLSGSGAVIVDGGDRDDHGSAFPGPDAVLGTTDDQNTEGWKFIEEMVEFADNGATNGAPNDILVIGASNQAFDAIKSVSLVLGLNTTVVTGTGIATVDFNQFSILYVPGDTGNVFGGISDADLTQLESRKFDILTFVNNGGSIVALTESEAAVPYGWLEIPSPFEIIGYGGGGYGSSTLYQTPALAQAGLNITDAELTAGTPWHNEFTGPVGFNGLVPFVMSPGDDDIPDDPNTPFLESDDDKVVTIGLPSGSTQKSPDGDPDLIVINGRLTDDNLLGTAQNNIVTITGFTYDISILNASLNDLDKLTVNSSDGNDTVIATDVEAVMLISINGGNGDDSLSADGSLTGSTGNDILIGGNSNNTLQGDAGNDTLEGAGGNDVMNGSLGDDTFRLPKGTDLVNDTEGNDTVDFSASSIAITVNLDTTSPQSVGGGHIVTLIGQIENFTGGTGNDMVTVNPLVVPRAIAGSTHLASPPGDTLNINTLCLPFTPQPPPTPNGAVTVGTLAPVSYTGTETVVILDQQPTMSINDVSTLEGHTATRALSFTVTLSSACSQTITAEFDTADNTAKVSDSDYLAASGSLTFLPTETSKTVTVTIIGDRTFEANETFFVDLSNITVAGIGDSQGIGTITNDDAAPLIAIADVSQNERHGGSSIYLFTVSLANPTDQTVTINYLSADNTAKIANSDYTGVAGVLTFVPGDTSETIAVTVFGDGVFEADETFFINLSGAVNAQFGDTQGVGTIVNDERITGNSAALDLDGDLNIDLVTAVPKLNVVNVQLGNGNGSFDPINAFAAGATPVAVTAGDFNSDGKVDIAAANSKSNDVSILLGNGAGGFGAPASFQSGRSPMSIGSADFNEDGKTDLVTANRKDNNIGFLRGNGNGTFQSPLFIAVGLGPTGLRIADFDADGHADIAVLNQKSRNVAILLGNGNGTFRSAVYFGVSENPSALAVGNFNPDLLDDLAVADSKSNSVSVLLRTAGSFSAPSNYLTGLRPTAVAAGDVNGDGIADLVISNSKSRNVTLLLNNGTGSFITAANYALAVSPYAVAVADFNNDTKGDIAVLDANGNLTSLFLFTP